jgi:deoxyadenosine/deoxycytidine kinase
MDARDYATYREISELLFAELAPPDVILYLRVSVPVLLERIRARGRPYEQSIDPRYLEALNDRYEAWARGYPYGRMVIVEADAIDPRRSAVDLTEIGRKIGDALGQHDLFGEL